MTQENHLRQEIRPPLEAARSRVRIFTGLYSDEDLAQEVLSACDEVLLVTGASARLLALRQVVEARCRTLAEVTSRFSARDPVTIAAARRQVIVALDLFQDAAFELRKATISQGPQGLLRRQSR